MAFQPRLPDILVAESGDTIAVWREDALRINNKRKDRYATEQWTELYGLGEGATLKVMPYCIGSDECYTDVKGYRFGYTKNYSALNELCAKSDILVTRFPIDDQESCNAKYVIDFWDVWRDGAHAVYLNDQSVEIETVNQIRGKRPWTSHKSAN